MILGNIKIEIKSMNKKYNHEIQFIISLFYKPIYMLGRNVQ